MTCLVLLNKTVTTQRPNFNNPIYFNMSINVEVIFIVWLPLNHIAYKLVISLLHSSDR